MWVEILQYQKKKNRKKKPKYSRSEGMYYSIFVLRKKSVLGQYFHKSFSKGICFVLLFICTCNFKISVFLQTFAYISINKSKLLEKKKSKGQSEALIHFHIIWIKPLLYFIGSAFKQ